MYSYIHGMGIKVYSTERVPLPSCSCMVCHPPLVPPLESEPIIKKVKVNKDRAQRHDGLKDRVQRHDKRHKTAHKRTVKLDRHSMANNRGTGGGWLHVVR